MAALCAASVDANAGGFAVREQSAYGQGSSFAGVAAGGSLSSMFWNPATMTQAPGLQVEMVASGIFPYAANTPDPASTWVPFASLGFGGTSNTANSALVPAGYASWQLNPNLWLGISVNSPFGLSVSFPTIWAGRDYAGSTSLKTYNATPSVAYKINDWISVGVGVQIEYGDASLTKGLTLPSKIPLPYSSDLSGNGWGYGFTAGVTLTPLPTTTIGIGWRSAINQKIDGTLSPLAGAPFPFPLPPFPLPATLGAVSTTLNLPDIVTASVRHRLNAQWTLLGTVEWSNWSRIGTSNITPAMVNGKPVTIPFQYQDGWFFSGGAEYMWSDRLTLRTGIGYEISPITDGVRIPLLPDNDRTWVSVGSSYHISRDLVADLAYSHLFVKNTPINISAASGNPSYNGIATYIGSVSPHIDILSVALKYRFN